MTTRGLNFARYIEALGGTLGLVARFSDHPHPRYYRGSLTTHQSSTRELPWSEPQPGTDRADQHVGRGSCRPSDTNAHTGHSAIAVSRFDVACRLEYGLDRKKITSEKTIDGLTWAIEVHLIPAIGNFTIRKLDCEHVEAMLADLAAAGMSTSSLTRIHSTLTRVLKWAQSRGKVLRNVSDLVQTPVGTQRPSHAFTVAQVGLILHTAVGDRLEALWVLGLVLGVRPGELTGLRWPNVDLDTGIITIFESLKHRKGKLTQGTTKTPKSRRKIKALPIAIAALAAHKERQQAERLAAGVHWVETDYVFTTTIGTAIDPANLGRAFRALVAAAGIPAKQPTKESPKPGQWHPHEMRHSAGSYMDAMGIPRERIAAILGHDGTRTTEEVYIHGQEVIDMTGAVSAPYGNQFGNQPEERTAE